MTYSGSVIMFKDSFSSKISLVAKTVDCFKMCKSPEYLHKYEIKELSNVNSVIALVLFVNPAFNEFLL